MLFLLLVVWASDIGAYLAGRLVGGPKLAPRDLARQDLVRRGRRPARRPPSCGLLVAAGAGGPAAGRPLRRDCLLRSGLSSQAGDLLESAYQAPFRRQGFGPLIPGHGGLLDRLDGMLAAAPAAALLALVIGEGVWLWQ